LKTNLVKNRVKRGARVPQTNYMSDDIYQVMLKCWQVDLEERASFKELEEILYSYLMQQETNKHISFENYSGFQYEMYVPELEVKSTTFPGGNNGSNNAPGV
ncbi:Wsck CG31127PAlike, partial [Caligus rogercresseyi]